MKIGDHIKEGDLIKAHGCQCLVLQVLPPEKNQKSDRIEILSDDGRIWKTRLDYTKWSIINECR